MGIQMVSNLPRIMIPESSYDVAIAGGGLAGLSAAIRLAQAGHKVILLEKEQYPFHKVCGEYISLESWDYLKRLGLDLESMNLPIINRLIITAPGGNSFSTRLPLGGFGISRFLLDQKLAEIARKNGVIVLEKTKMTDVIYHENIFSITVTENGETQIIEARLCLAASGKRSNLDLKWKRDFLKKTDPKLDNYVGIKYHIQTDWPADLIGLHNFENGYCGISKIEENKFCLCYMTHADNLKKAGNNISQLEKNILHRNPHLEIIFTTSKVCEGFPITISQISFCKKKQVENHILMTGDAAGMITPLCGNGMSIALHTGKIAAGLTTEFLQEKISADQLEKKYAKAWQENFGNRLQTGRRLQQFFGSTRRSEIFVRTFKTFPFLARPLIKMTHGKSF